jgi:hypothetical protein
MGDRIAFEAALVERPLRSGLANPRRSVGLAGAAGRRTSTNGMSRVAQWAYMTLCSMIYTNNERNCFS